MPRSDTLLFAGKISSWEQAVLKTVASATCLHLETTETSKEATSRLASLDPSCVLVDLTLSGARDLFAKIRCSRKLAGVPAIALSHEVGDLRFMKALYWGADDLVLWSSVPELIARINARAPGPPEVAITSQGLALVVEPNHRRCEIVGRLLNNAGYDVRYAVDQRSAQYYLSDSTPQVIVLNASVGNLATPTSVKPPDAHQPIWVILTNPDKPSRSIRKGKSASKMVHLDLRAAPDQVLFAINQVRQGAVDPGTVFHGAMVSFRPEGALSDDYGFSYEVGLSCLFVRTLRAVDCERVWVDARPPLGERQVRLLARVESRVGLTARTDATTPPGFRARILDGLGDDLANWAQACTAAAAARDDAVATPSIPPRSSRVEVRVDQWIREALSDTEEDLVDRESTFDDLLEPPKR